MESDKIIFNDSSLLYLQKIAKEVKTTTGERHRLADENSMLRLLKVATESKHNKVQDNLDQFSQKLDAKQHKLLSEQGISLKAQQA